MYLYWSYKDRSRGSNLECRINQSVSDNLESWIIFFKASRHTDKVIESVVDSRGRTIRIVPRGD